MNVEHAVKIRSEIRATEILPILWELDYKFYIIGIVRFQATFFMLQVFVFVQRIARYRFEAKNARRRELEDRDDLSWALARLGLLFWLSTPPDPLSTPPLLILFIFIYFLIFLCLLIFNNFFWTLKNHKNHEKYFLYFLHFILFYILFFLIK